MALNSAEVENWAKCFYKLMYASVKAKIEFANRVGDLKLKTLLKWLACEHLKIAETLKTLIDIGEVSSGGSWRECRDSLGTINIR